jgi:hypothetical protein
LSVLLVHIFVITVLNLTHIFSFSIICQYSNKSDRLQTPHLLHHVSFNSLTDFNVQSGMHMYFCTLVHKFNDTLNILG